VERLLGWGGDERRGGSGEGREKVVMRKRESVVLSRDGL
jgi:hypothetical protein